MRRAIATITIVTLLAALVALASCGSSDSSSTSAPTATAPPAATAPATSDSGTPAAVDGATVYADNCSGCHSADGSGGQGPNIAAQTDAQHVADQVENGGTAMPAFAGTLTSEQVDAVAEYVTTQL